MDMQERGQPGLVSMAILALGAEVSGVDIGFCMAGPALGWCTAEGFVLVAVAASDFGVRPG